MASIEGLGMSGYTASYIDRLLSEAPYETNRLRRYLVEKMIEISVTLQSKQTDQDRVKIEDVRYSYCERPRMLSVLFKSIRFYFYVPDGPQKSESMDLWTLNGDKEAEQLLYCPKRCTFVVQEQDGLTALYPEEVIGILSNHDPSAHRMAAIKALTLLIDAAAS